MKDTSAAPSSHSAQQPSKPAAESGFRLGRVLTLIVPLVLVVLLVFYLGTTGGLSKIFGGLFGAQLVPATGQVLIDGKPWGGGQIQTKLVGSDQQGSAAFPDKDGKFTLQVNINGDWKDGAYAGEHLVRISVPDMTRPATGGPPPFVTPSEFHDFTSTKLKITVVPGEKNFFELKIPRAPAPTGGPGGFPMAAPGQAPPADPDDWVKSQLETLDADKNGELSRDEAAAASGQLAAALAGADGNRDGKLTSEELKSVASQVLRLSRPQAEGPGGAPSGAPSGAPGRPEAETPAEDGASDGEAAGGESPAAESSP